MGSYYELRVSSNAEQKRSIEALLGKSDLVSSLDWWGIYIEEDSPKYAEALPHFLSIIELHLNQLLQIGISSDMISIWYMYEYVHQCNMEFGPDITRKLGNLGIRLCITCWEK